MDMTQSSEKHTTWPVPKKPKAGLYLVATPIGNLRDITLRALDVLTAADVIVCEDTRVSGKLLQAFDIKAPSLLSYNDHSDDKRREQIVAEIRAGKIVALISDAGCPLISDPGYKLVRFCAEQGLPVTSIPGPSAVITGLQLSSLPSDAFCFIGFLPAKQKARRDALMHWKSQAATLIAYETGPRLYDSLCDIHAVLGNRKVCMARELTKMYEEVRTEAVINLITHYKEHGAPKGEIVLIIEGSADKVWRESELKKSLIEALKTMRTKEAAAYISEISGEQKKVIYDMALKLSGKA
jgi:16S rRNA (cytidine1402-2'-O)-methyltransferase